MPGAQRKTCEKALNAGLDAVMTLKRGEQLRALSTTYSADLAHNPGKLQKNRLHHLYQTSHIKSTAARDGPSFRKNSLPLSGCGVGALCIRCRGMHSPTRVKSSYFCNKSPGGVKGTTTKT